MAEPIDFAGILSRQIQADWEVDIDPPQADDDAVVSILANPDELVEALMELVMPAACRRVCHDQSNDPCVNCPTIGQMLVEWQPLMALAEYARHLLGCDVGIHGRGEFCSCGLDAARAALREVRHHG